jgi:hypothetical protein
MGKMRVAGAAKVHSGPTRRKMGKSLEIAREMTVQMIPNSASHSPRHIDGDIRVHVRLRA